MEDLIISLIVIVFLVLAVYYVIENAPNDKPKETEIDNKEGILLAKNQKDSINSLREESIRLIHKLYELGNLSLTEVNKERENIYKLINPNDLGKIVNGLKNKIEHVEYNIKQNTSTNKHQDITKDQFISNILLSTLSPIILFIITFYVAIEIDINRGYFSWKGSPFDWKDTWWVWAIFLIVIFLVEKKLFSIRNRSKYFNKNIFRILYYLSNLSTILGSIVYFMTINVQLFSRVGRSSRDGFLLQAFFFCYILPVLFWIVYYAVIKNNDFFKSLLDKKKQKIKNESIALKREQAIKELKEAKDLLDLGILSIDEYDNLSKKLKPIILGAKL